MKVKNLMFSGFAAAMFAGVMGSADAATYNLASKNYVDTEIGKVETEVEKKQDALTAGNGITITTGENGVTTIDTKPIQIGEQDVPVADAITNVTNEITNITNVLGEIPDNTTVQAELDKKVDTATYNDFVADQAQRDADQDTAIALIEGGEGGVGGIADLVTRVSAAEGEIDTLQSGKEDVLNKTTSASELTDMSAQDKAKKYTSVAVAEAIAEAAADVVAERVDTLVGTVGNAESGLVKDVADLKQADTDLDGRVDTLETAVNDETNGLVKKVADLETADTALGGRVDTLEGTVGDAESGLVKDVADLKQADTDLGGRVDTLETNVGDTPVETQIDNKIDALNLEDTYETKAAVTEAKYVSAKDATAQGGYLVKVDNLGNVSMLEVAIVNSDGTKDMITDTALNVTVD